MRIRALLTTILLCGLALPAAASASFTIGNPLTGDAIFNSSTGHCLTGTACTYLQTDSSAVPVPQYVVPGNLPHGVITSWSFKASSGNDVLQVLRPQGAGKYIEVGHSNAVPAAGGSTAATSALRLPVQAGDAIALSNDTNALVYNSTASANDVVQEFTPPVAATAVVPNPPATVQRQLMIRATVEPDADNDGYGDETQDLCPTDPLLQTACSSDLQVTITGSASSVKLGQIANYTVVVHNAGTSPATNAQLVLTVPGVATSVTSNVGFCGATGCSFGTLANGATATVIFSVVTTAIGPLSISATVGSAIADANSANNGAATTTTVTLPDPVLSLLSLSSSRFHRGTKVPRVSPSLKATPTSIRFTLSEAAIVKLSFAKLDSHNHATNVGSFNASGKGGNTRVIFSGVLSKLKRLSPGRYRVTASGRTSDGRKTGTQTVQFTLLPAL